MNATLANSDNGPKRLRILAFLLLSAGVAALLIDTSVASWLKVEKIHSPKLIRKLIEFSELFAHGLGVAIILLTIWVLDVNNRRKILRVMATALGSGLLANVLKLLVHRQRPRVFDFNRGVLETFGGWLPLGEGGSNFQSLPSAHTATAFGFAVGLTWLYPRGKYLFASFAILSAIQRVESLAHFVSDTCWGAAVGLFFASVCLYSSPLSRRFDKFEHRLDVELCKK